MTNHWDRKRIKAKKKRHLKVLERNLFKLPIFPVEKFNKTPWGLQGFFRGGVALGLDLFPLCPGLEIRPDAPGSAYE